MATFDQVNKLCKHFYIGSSKYIQIETISLISSIGVNVYIRKLYDFKGLMDYSFQAESSEIINSLALLKN